MSLAVTRLIYKNVLDCPVKKKEQKTKTKTGHFLNKKNAFDDVIGNAVAIDALGGHPEVVDAMLMRSVNN